MKPLLVGWGTVSLIQSHAVWADAWVFALVWMACGFVCYAFAFPNAVETDKP